MFSRPETYALSFCFLDSCCGYLVFEYNSDILTQWGSEGIGGTWYVFLDPRQDSQTG